MLVPERATSQKDFRRHIGLSTEKGIEVELHHFFSISDNADQDEVLDDMLFRAIPLREKKEVCGYTVPVLPPLENGLVLLGHINQHLSSGLGLRQIIDWMLYVETVMDDVFWENAFAEKAEAIGKKRLAVVVTAMCRKYLGLEKDIRWCPYEPICDELMEYILAKGNFGKKIEKGKSSTVAVLKRAKNPISGLVAAQRGGRINWKATQKYKILRPFAWVYQLGRWTKRGIESGVNLGTLSEASATAKKEAELLERLGATRL